MISNYDKVSLRLDAALQLHHHGQCRNPPAGTASAQSSRKVRLRALGNREAREGCAVCKAPACVDLGDGLLLLPLEQHGIVKPELSKAEQRRGKASRKLQAQ